MNFEKIIKKYKVCNEIEEEFEWKKWVEKIPKLSFKEDWNVKIIPPFGGAISRFTIDKNNNNVSVYLDGYDMLGIEQYPYWEVYDGNNTERFKMEDTKELLNYIESILEKNNENVD